ncbi:MAG: amidohydrolase family protein [Gammaproteobacteria bacterium]
MQALIRDALEAGAIGFASSQSQNHAGYGGVPMPSRLADEAELRALVGVLREAGKGLFQITVGPHIKVAFLESLAADCARPVIFSALFQNDAFPKRAPTMLAQSQEAHARGHRVYAQVACHPLTMEFTLANAYPMQSLEVWAALRGADQETLQIAYRKADFRRAFRDQLAHPAKGKLFYGNWRNVDINQVADPRHRELEGLNIADAAAQRGVDPVDLFFDLGLAERLQTLFSAKLLNVDENKVEPLLRHSASIISLSDAGAHLSYLCDAGFGLNLLGHWVRDRHTFTLEEAIRQLTSWPAAIYGITDRGRITVGAYADLMLFDPDSVGISGLKRVHDLPAGGSRMIRESRGLHGVWVNGAQVWEPAGYRDLATAPGMILDRFSA